MIKDMLSIFVKSLITPATIAIFIIILAISLVFSFFLARYSVGFKVPLYVSSAALAFVFAVTLSPSGVNSGSVICAIHFPSNTGLADLPSITEQSANSLMLAPFGFFAALSFRKWWISPLALPLIPAIIETMQMLIPAIGRSCTIQDGFDNLTGGILGATFGLLFRFLFSIIYTNKNKNFAEQG
ncbi:VanZ family protein [Actinopolyspora xinjiangensis]|uniref:VanZ family protein n=1 Tax=Actinopolyspora xinjiangensis TaxID=405564 RepID=UPI000B86E67C|nr:VanZ family protein [Actinopolyspora xinjiangensis]